MSLFSYTIEIGSADLAKFESVELLVDTTSTYTLVPRDLANKLGLKTTGRRRIRLADGSEILRDGVDAYIRMNGEIHPNFCILADSDDTMLLGSITLETFSLGVDPINKKLIPIVSSAMISKG